MSIYINLGVTKCFITNTFLFGLFCGRIYTGPVTQIEKARLSFRRNKLHNFSAGRAIRLLGVAPIGSKFSPRFYPFFSFAPTLIPEFRIAGRDKLGFRGFSGLKFFSLNILVVACLVYNYLLSNEKKKIFLKLRNENDQKETFLFKNGLRN